MGGGGGYGINKQTTTNKRTKTTTTSGFKPATSDRGVHTLIIGPNSLECVEVPIYLLYLKIEVGEKKLTDVSSPMKKRKKINRFNKDNGEQER